MPSDVPGTARSSWASANTMFGLLPPSSSVTALELVGARALDHLADGLRTGERDLVDAGVREQRGAGLGADAGDDVEHAGRDPASSAIAAIRRAVSGVCSAGLSTTVQPVASAGATFWAAISIG